MFGQGISRNESDAALAVLDGFRDRLAARTDLPEPVFVAELESACTALATLAQGDASMFSGEELCLAATQIEHTRRFLDAASVHVLAELDSRGFTDSEHGMRTGAWLARESALSNPGAKSRVRTANKLRMQFPKVAEALRNGQISYDHAAAITSAANPRITDQLADISDQILNNITGTTYEKWKQQLGAAAELLDQEGGHRPGDDITDNTLSMHRGLNNTLFINAQLTGSHALAIEHTLNTHADQLFNQLNKDNKLTTDLPTPNRKTLLALALSNLAHNNTTANKATSSASSSTASYGSGIELAITINNTDTRLDLSKLTDHNNQPLSAELANTLTCNPTIYALLTTNNATTLHLTRTQRLANRAQRRALAHRDGGCVFPGCTNPPQWTDAHHVKHWNNEGTTDLSNLASLCRYHHMVTHRNGWTMTITPEQYFTWTTPNGTTLNSQRHQKQQPRPPP
jgi:hypothetical protein